MPSNKNKKYKRNISRGEQTAPLAQTAESLNVQLASSTSPAAPPPPNLTRPIQAGVAFQESVYANVYRDLKAVGIVAAIMVALLIILYFMLH
jgi:hypothetical protein